MIKDGKPLSELEHLNQAARQMLDQLAWWTAALKAAREKSLRQAVTLDFADAKGTIASQHYAFHVSDAEFDAIMQRVKDAGLAFGSGPGSLEDGKLNDWNGGRGFYYKDHDGHVIELMTMPQ